MPECVDLSVTIIGGTIQEPLTAYYAIAVKSSTNGSSYFPQFKDKTITIDNTRSWTVSLACRDVRAGLTSNHSASSFSIWDTNSQTKKSASVTH